MVSGRKTSSCPPSRSPGYSSLVRADVERALTMLQSGESVNGALSLLQDTVFSFSMKVYGHREDAQDTAQEVLRKAIPFLPRFDKPRALGVWLYKVAKNRCLMNRRRSRYVPLASLSLEDLMPANLEGTIRGLRETPGLHLDSKTAEKLRRRLLREYRTAFPSSA